MLSHGAQLKTAITLVPQGKHKRSKALELCSSPITALQKSPTRTCTLHSQIMSLAAQQQARITPYSSLVKSLLCAAPCSAEAEGSHPLATYYCASTRTGRQFYRASRKLVRYGMGCKASRGHPWPCKLESKKRKKRKRRPCP